MDHSSSLPPKSREKVASEIQFKYGWTFKKYMNEAGMNTHKNTPYRERWQNYRERWPRRKARQLDICCIYTIHVHVLVHVHVCNKFT